MSESSPKLDLPYIQPSQAQKHITHNEAIEKLDVLTQLVVSEFDAIDPPTLPVDGETHALGGSPTGAWASNPNEIAFYTGSGWLFVPPVTGWRAWGNDELRVWDGAAWTLINPPIESLDLLGINTTGDTTNRLSVSSDATLLTNAGAGHQLKINKAADTDTASLLFQSAWAGHAEMGLSGDTNFTVKVSPNGNSWYAPFIIDPNAKTVSLAPAGTTTVTASHTSLQIDTPVTGTAVQSEQNDDTQDRLMKVGAFGLGAPGAYLTDIDVIDNSIAPGIYQVDGSTIGAPRNWGLHHLLHTRRSESGGETQLALVEDDSAIFYRSRGGGTWNNWQQVATSNHYTGNLSSPDSAPIFERGTNSNGDYTRFADGTQFCWHDITLNYNWARELYGSWTYAAAFLSTPKVFCSIDYGSFQASASPEVDAISTVAVESPAIGYAQFRLMRAAGQTDFASGDSATVSVLAFGRWK